MKLTFFCKYGSRGPSSRYRFYQYREVLEKNGITPQFNALLDDHYFTLREKGAGKSSLVPYSLGRYLKRVGQVLNCPESFGKTTTAGLILEHQLFPYLPSWVEHRFLDAKPPYTVEFDDAIFRTPGHHPKMGQLCQRAKAVIVGNPVLADYAKTYSKRVEVVPTVVDLNRYDVLPMPDQPFTVAWIGLPYNFTYLSLLSAPLKKLRQQRPVRFLVISSLPPGKHQFDGDFDFIPWSEKEEAQALSRCHVGVMPLLDTDWERGKCGLKLLQYMAAGRPVIASPVGVNRTIVQDGDCGYLAASEQDWDNALWALAADPKAAEEMGRQGRKRVQDQYSLQVWGPKVAGLYQDLFGS